MAKVSPTTSFKGEFTSYQQNIYDFFNRFPMEKIYTMSAWGLLMQILPSFYLQACPLAEARGVVARVRPHNPVVANKVPSFVCYVHPQGEGTLEQIRLPAWLKYIPYSQPNPPRFLAAPGQKQSIQASLPSWEELAQFVYLQKLFEHR